MTTRNRQIMALYADGAPIDTLAQRFGLSRAELENIIDDEPITDAQKVYIRQAFDDGVTINALARQYGVSRDRIDNIVSLSEYTPIMAEVE